MRKTIAALLPILLLTVGHGAVDSYLGLLQVLAPGLSSHLNIPLGDLVMLVGLAAFVANAVQPFIGHIMGKINIAWALGFSVALSSLPVVMGIVPGYWSLVGLVLFGAIGNALYHPEAVLSAHDAAGSKAYLGVPMFMAGGGGICAAVAPLAVWISETFGFTAILWLGLPGLVIAALLFRSYRRLKSQHPSMVIRPRSKRITKIQPGNVSFWPLLATGICLCVGSGLFLSILTSHFELVFGPTARNLAGWAMMIFGVAGALCSFLWSAASQRYGFYTVALATQAVAFPLFVLIAFIPSPVVAVLVSIPLGLVAPASVHPMAVALSRNAAGSTQAMRSSLMIGGTYGVAALTTMGAGVLLRNHVASTHLILFVAGCSFVAAALSFWQRRATRQTRV